MSKAEEKSKKLIIPKQVDDIEELCRFYYIEGYHQAEEDLTDKAQFSSCLDGFYYGQGYQRAKKDLELGWEDMFDIFRLVNEVLDDYAEGKTKKEVGEEVLKRFKDFRERKEK